MAAVLASISIRRVTIFYDLRFFEMAASHLASLCEWLEAEEGEITMRSEIAGPIIRATLAVCLLSFGVGSTMAQTTSTGGRAAAVPKPVDAKEDVAEKKAVTHHRRHHNVIHHRRVIRHHAVHHTAMKTTASTKS
jgi:hypothetical protein